MNDHVTELLPWYVNGRLPVKDVERVSMHLEHCAKCAVELNVQQKIHAAINMPGKVEIAPQPSFNKLWDRIAAEEFGEDQAPTQPEAAGRSAVKPRAWNLSGQIRSYWMHFMLVTQAAAIAVLLGMMVMQRTTTASASDGYRTVTSTPVLNGPVIHVVFDDATRLADIKDILLRSSLQVAAGPTAAGVYSLMPAGKHAGINMQDTINALRDDPRVRFAELSHE